MTSQYLQSLSAPVASAHGQAAGPDWLLPGGAAKPIANALRRLRRMFTEIDRRRRVEYENRKAIAHLRSLTDAQLQDIGIRRHDIEHGVREGRSSI